MAMMAVSATRSFHDLDGESLSSVNSAKGVFGGHASLSFAFCPALFGITWHLLGCVFERPIFCAPSRSSPIDRTSANDLTQGLHMPSLIGPRVSATFVAAQACPGAGQSQQKKERQTAMP